MAGKKRKKLTCIFYMLDRETGEATPVDQVPEEALQKMRERLCSNMSDYYTRHMDEYMVLNF